MSRRPLRLVCCILLFLGCTNAGLYNSNGRGVNSPDRASFEGQVCIPRATGEAFPVKVLFAVQGGDGVSPEAKAGFIDGLQSVTGRFLVPYIKFSLVAFHTVATGLAGSFVDTAAFQQAIVKYSQYQEVGSVSLRAPLLLAKTILSGDMQTDCQGAVSRTRYVVVLLVTSDDTSCVTPQFNTGIDSACAALTPASACSQCELSRVTSEIVNLAQLYQAGEVRVQPVYVRETIDPAAAAAVGAIAQAGGTAPIQTTPNNIVDTLNQLDYTSLDQNLALKRFIAFNRNALSRNGQLLADSDGDGLSDADEASMGLLAVQADSDGDGISDGLEMRMGLDPRVADVINGCSPFLDIDADGLNDCEERVVGTNSCMGDTDGDGVPDLVEVLSRLNPLVPEDLLDSDGDGADNVAETTAHTDAQSVDTAYRNDRGYNYQLLDAEPTPDGRACYTVRVDNVSLVATQARPNPPLADIPAGTNDIYLYMQTGRPNAPRSAGVGAVNVVPIRFTPPSTRSPEGLIPIAPEDFTLGM